MVGVGLVFRGVPVKEATVFVTDRSVITDATGIDLQATLLRGLWSAVVSEWTPAQFWRGGKPPASKTKTTTVKTALPVKPVPWSMKFLEHLIPNKPRPDPPFPKPISEHDQPAGAVTVMK